MQEGGVRAGRRLWWHADDHRFIAEQSPSCEYVLPELGQGSIRIRSAWNNAALLVTGSLPPFAEIRSIDVGEGRWLNWEDNRQRRRVAFIGSEVREQLFAAREAVGQSIHIADVPYTVVGVMQAKQQDSSYDGQDVRKVFVPFSAMIAQLPNRPPLPATSVDRLLVAPRSLADHENCKGQVRRALAARYDFNPLDEEAVPIWDTIENAKAFAQMTDGMKYFLGAVGVATLFLGGIGVMNIMLVAVRERTREIGVRKAVGASRGAILRQFFAETMLVVLASGAVGLAVGFGICWLVNSTVMADASPTSYFAGLQPTLGSSLGAFALLGTVAVLAGFYPAHKAASVDPIEALRYEAGG
jgi:putative ABC transport system permease protein